MNAQDMTLEDAQVEISNKVYEAVIHLYEALELVGKIYGNGHHAAQITALLAKDELTIRWVKECRQSQPEESRA